MQKRIKTKNYIVVKCQFNMKKMYNNHTIKDEYNSYTDIPAL